MTARSVAPKLKVEISLPPLHFTMEDKHAYLPFTVDQIILQLSRFTTDQRSLAWSPQPPFESSGAGDCRVGGNCALDFNQGTPRARWTRARHRWNLEQKRLQAL